MTNYHHHHWASELIIKTLMAFPGNFLVQRELVQFVDYTGSRWQSNGTEIQAKCLHRDLQLSTVNFLVKNSEKPLFSRRLAALLSAMRYQVDSHDFRFQHHRRAKACDEGEARQWFTIQPNLLVRDPFTQNIMKLLRRRLFKMVTRLS